VCVRVCVCVGVCVCVWVGGGCVCACVWMGVFLVFHWQHAPLHSNTVCFGFLN